MTMMIWMMMIKVIMFLEHSKLCKFSPPVVYVLDYQQNEYVLVNIHGKNAYDIPDSNS